jgi:hypothetical protein
VNDWAAPINILVATILPYDLAADMPLEVGQTPAAAAQGRPPGLVFILDPVWRESSPKERAKSDTSTTHQQVRWNVTQSNGAWEHEDCVSNDCPSISSVMGFFVIVHTEILCGLGVLGIRETDLLLQAKQTTIAEAVSILLLMSMARVKRREISPGTSRSR